MHSGPPTLSFSILAFRLFCTSRLPSFLAYQIEANIVTGEIIRFSRLQGQPDRLYLLPIWTEWSLSTEYSAQARAKKERGREKRQDDAEGGRVCTAKSGLRQP